MDATDIADAPIYNQLIAERGDAVADVARVAEQSLREAPDALDFGSLGSSSDE